MVCVYCGASTSVVNSRQQRQTNNIWRRRKCTKCESVFTTNEITDLAGAIRFSSQHEGLTPFSRDKLFISLYESCKHRPTAVSDASNIAQQVVIRLLKMQDPSGLFARRDVIATCIEVLKSFDGAAATFYAAYHPI